VATRYRPPRPAQSRYITREGAKALQDELDHLWRVERPRVTQEVSEAAAHGDRSENAEYIYGKKRLREIDRRLRYLGKRLDEVQIVQPTDRGDDRVYFGAWVRLEDDDGEEVEYRIVGPDEADAKRRFISMDSPMGKALIGRAVGNEVIVRRPKGDKSFEIVGVHYDAE